jgi:ribosomal-protein-alanine N-acetyltransferase
MVRWKIHEMRREHIEQVLEIERASFLTPWTHSMFLNELSSPLSYPFIVTGSETRDDAVVCYIIFWMLLEEVHILNLATHPAYRRLGIAHSLLHFSLDFAGEDALIMRLFYGDRAYEKRGDEQTRLP